MFSDADHQRLAIWRRENAEGIKRKRGWTLLVMQAEYAEALRLARGYRADHVAEKKQHAEDLKLLTDFYWMIEDERAKLRLAVESECPIGFFKPSWEQAQVLNCWHPDYDPAAPDGYQSICNFGGVRLGKTTGMIINTQMWFGPDNPDWVMHEPYTDHLGREVKVFVRFKWDEWKRSGRRIYDPSEPPKLPCVNWQGCVDENHWTLKVEPAYRRWIPDAWIARRGKDKEWYKADKWFKTRWGSVLAAKLYNSDMTAWSGEELFHTNCDEGPPKDKIDEVIVRSQYVHIAFTPREAANLGGKSALAQAIWEGDDEASGGQPLVGKKKFFFPEMKDAPEQVMSAEKREQRIKTAEAMGEAGRAVIGGGFFQSSARVFSHFKPAHSILPVDGPMIVRAIRGELQPEELRKFSWLERLKDANIVRGFDEGLAHPSACAWLAVLQTGERILFREMEEQNASIQERCVRIVSMSGNERRILRSDAGRLSQQDQMLAMQFAPEIVGDREREKRTGHRQPRYVEHFLREPVRRTVGDSKLFKRDPNYPLDNWGENYAREGLRMIRAVNIGPAERCDKVNGMFRLDSTRKHLVPGMGGDEGYGAQLYLTNDLPIARKRIEKYLFEQFVSGSRRGQNTGKPGASDDDLLDAICYAACEQMTWIEPAKYAAQAWQKNRTAQLEHV